MIAPLADNIVRKQLAGLVADAEALLRVALHRDCPGGIVILDDVDPARKGSAIGSGHWLAQAAGCRPGAVAVRVAVPAILRCWLAESPDDPATAIAGAAIDAELTAAHEAAHALASRPDVDIDAEAAVELVRRADSAGHTQSPEAVAAHHDAAWAAAYAIIATRCAGLRPCWSRGVRRRWLRRHLARYGHELPAIEAAIGAVAGNELLRELLAHEGDIAGRIAAAARPEGQRAAVIRQWIDSPRQAGPRVAASAMGAYSRGLCDECDSAPPGSKKRACSRHRGSCPADGEGRTCSAG